MARRSIARPDEFAYYLAHAPTGTTVDQLVTVAGSRWAIESCFRSAKNKCGLDECEVRRHPGWYRHITLAMLAHAVLAAMTAQARTEKGVAETDHPLPRSAWQMSAGSWQLAAPAQARPPPPSSHRSGTEMVPLAPPAPGHRHALPLQPAHRRSRNPAT